MQKINFIFHVFLEILQCYSKLVILGTLDMLGYAYPKWYYQLVENFRLYLQAKNQLHPRIFLEIKNKHHHSLNWDILFQRILQCDWLMAFCPYLENQNFVRDRWWISKATLVFILDYFQEKLFEKIQNPILEPFWALFAQIWAKTNFPGKKGSASF